MLKLTGQCLDYFFVFIYDEEAKMYHIYPNKHIDVFIKTAF